jgi:glycosyltransferase involved in cell wall biosynthesis
MNDPDIFIALPVYRGQEVVAETLRSIRDQTYKRYRVLVSLDGEDPASREACRPFESDPRVKVVVQPQRLGWGAHFNWLLDACDLPYFCYWQQDDLAATNYLETLRAGFLTEPEAAIHYADVQWFGFRYHRESTPSVVGSAVERVLKYIEGMRWEPLRGLIRTACVPRPQALDLRSEDGCMAEFPFLTALASQGGLIRCENTLYFKRANGANAHLRWFSWPDEKRRQCWIEMGLSVLAVVRRTISDPRRYPELLALALDRLAIQRPGRGFFYQLPEQSAAEVERFVRDFLIRGNIEVPATDPGGKSAKPIRRPIHPYVRLGFAAIRRELASRETFARQSSRTRRLSDAVNTRRIQASLLLETGRSQLRALRRLVGRGARLVLAGARRTSRDRLGIGIDVRRAG